ncbi:MAG: hypothetical protein Salg2KO_15730 [Salibacteraceae bacterium]
MLSKFFTGRKKARPRLKKDLSICKVEYDDIRTSTYSLNDLWTGEIDVLIVKNVLSKPEAEVIKKSFDDWS